MTRERSQNNSGFGACFSSMSMQGQVYLWMAEVITTRKGCWRNCTTVPYDLVSYSSTNCSQNVWSSCAVTVNSECKHTHTPKCLATACALTQLGKSTQSNSTSSTSQLSLTVFFMVQRSNRLLLCGVPESMTSGELKVLTLSTLTDHLKLTWALPRALIRPILFAAQLNCQNLFAHRLVTRPVACVVLWAAAINCSDNDSWLD